MQFEFSHRLLWRGEQCVCQQAYRRYGCRGIDPAHDGIAEFVDNVANPGWPLLLVRPRFPPIGICRIEQGLERYLLSNVDVDLAKIFAQ